MKATLDHVGIAVSDLQAALAFYRDALGLEIEAPEEVTSQRVRAHFLPLGEGIDGGAGPPGVKLELLEPTSPDSPVQKFIDKRGEGLHHMTFQTDDLAGRLENLKKANIGLIDETPRIGAGGACIAFIHPKSAHGVLIELCEYHD